MTSRSVVTVHLAAVLKLRWTEPHLHRPFRVWTFIPVLFCLLAAVLFACLVILSPTETLIACGFIAAGVPVSLAPPEHPRALKRPSVRAATYAVPFMLRRAVFGRFSTVAPSMAGYHQLCHRDANLTFRQVKSGIVYWQITIRSATCTETAGSCTRLPRQMKHRMSYRLFLRERRRAAVAGAGVPAARIHQWC